MFGELACVGMVMKAQFSTVAMRIRIQSFVRSLVISALIPFALCTSFLSASAQTDPLDVWHGPASFPSGFVTVNGVAYGNGTFIAVGNNGALALSPDGSNWTQYLSPPVVYYGGVTFAGGQFFAYGSVAGTSTNYILRSSDGQAWAKGYEFSGGLPKAAAYGNNRVVFVGSTRIITTTLPTTNWIEFQLPSDTPLSGVTFGMGRFVACGRNTAATPKAYILSSADGVNWRYDYGPSTEAASVSGIAYGNGVLVVPWGTNGTSNAGFLVSTNLVSWNYTPLPDLGSAGTIAFGGGQFIATVGNQVLGSQVLTSSNGIDWVYRTNAPVVGSYTYGQGKFLAGTRWQSDVFANPASSPSNLVLAMFPGVSITGTEGQTYRIETSTNLAPGSVWQPLTNFTLPFSPYLWIDATAPGQSRKFYRAVQIQ